MNLLILAAFQLAFSHGENHPGPNGGKIQMPGSFHTEVVSKNDEVQVYLLDINFENPTVDNSTLTAYLKTSDKKQSLNCEKKTNFFACSLPKEKFKGNLVLEAVRSGAKGNEATYPWPLK